ncbi:MAG: hypothetical protein IT385_21615 [Deltaproteobacteria bacterium]|nr:hypothetical protein [Deltaproteobacteria bacterium]
MAAVWTQGAVGASRGSGLAGRVIIGDAAGGPRATTGYDVEGIKIGRRGVTFPFPVALEPGRFAWVELSLGGGRVIKPLVAVLGAQDGVVSARIVHCFPEHQRALDAHLASASGY